MGFIRPATPGFIVTLVATILLAVVVFCVPYFKSIYFLKATISVGKDSGSITFGTLGYCLELSNGTTCSSPSIGYQLDINGLVGNKFSVQIPQVAVKWITYALVLHVVALVGAAGSAVFGLLAHVREMSMTCCSTFVSGFAAVVAMLAFIVDLILFFVAKARINQVGSAQIGNAIWLTLAAWVLLFFSGCFYTIGRCCISKRPSGGSGGGRKDPESGRQQDDLTEQLRLDAVKAEADRKARQKKAEGGLPVFGETAPLTARIDGDHVYFDDDAASTDHLTAAAAAPGRKPSGGGYAGGYVQGRPGQRAVDEYYNSRPIPQSPVTSYPPQRQASSYSANVAHSPSPQPPLPSQHANYGYAPYGNNSPLTTSPPPAASNLLAPQGQYQDQYDQSGRAYGHAAGGSSYHTAQHGQQRSAYSQYDPYNETNQTSNQYIEPYQPSPQVAYNPPMPNAADYGSPNPYMHASSPPPPQHQQYHQPERSYTLGGDGYGASSAPPLPGAYSTTDDVMDSYYHHQQRQVSTPYAPTPPLHSSPPPINTNVGVGGYTSSPVNTSPVKGPRPPPGAMQESPPGYELSSTGVSGNWGKR